MKDLFFAECGDAEFVVNTANEALAAEREVARE